MGTHFDTATLAIAHLIAKGWKQAKTGTWFFNGRDCEGPYSLRARVLTIPETETVLLQVWKI